MLEEVSNDDTLIEMASEAFLVAVQSAIPGINNDAGQVWGEEQTAIATWLFDDATGLPPPHCEDWLPTMLPAEAVLVEHATSQAVAAIRLYITNARPSLAVCDPSAAVLSQLAACIRILHYYSKPHGGDESAAAILGRLGIGRGG